MDPRPTPLCACVTLCIFFFLSEATKPRTTVRCSDCSGVGCQSPGVCHTTGKCFLRRDVNGLLYRGCADGKRWNGLDLSYDGCRWQTYLGWAGRRVLWCLCQELNCNNVTVANFLKRHYVNVTSSQFHPHVNVTLYKAADDKPRPELTENVLQPASAGRIPTPGRGGSTRVKGRRGEGAGAGNTLSKGEAGRREADPREAGPREAGPSEAGPREAGPREAGPREAGPREAGPREAGPREAGPREAGPREASRREAGPREADPTDTGPREADPSEADPKYGTNSRGDNVAIDNAGDDGSSESHVTGVTGAETANERGTHSNKFSGKSYPDLTPTEGALGGESGITEAPSSVLVTDEGQTPVAVQFAQENPVNIVVGPLFTTPLPQTKAPPIGTKNNQNKSGSPQEIGDAKETDDYRWLVGGHGNRPFEPIDTSDLDETDADLRPPGVSQTADQPGLNEFIDGPVFSRGAEGPQLLPPEAVVLDPEVEVSTPSSSTVPVSVVTTSETDPASLDSGQTTRHPLEKTLTCPPNFQLVPHLRTCYLIVRQPRSQRAAQRHCRELHPQAHLVSLDRPGEYEYVVLKVALQSSLLNGWQGWWTSATYNFNIREFVWEDSGRVLSRLDPRWRPPLLLRPFSRTCVWMVPLSGFRLGNYACRQPAGAICEVNL